MIAAALVDAPIKLATPPVAGPAGYNVLVAVATTANVVAMLADTELVVVAVAVVQMLQLLLHLRWTRHLCCRPQLWLCLLNR